MSCIGGAYDGAEPASVRLKLRQKGGRASMQKMGFINKAERVAWQRGGGSGGGGKAEGVRLPGRRGRNAAIYRRYASSEPTPFSQRAPPINHPFPIAKLRFPTRFLYRSTYVCHVHPRRPSSINKSHESATTSTPALNIDCSNHTRTPLMASSVELKYP